jgi:protein gp37
MGGGKKKSATHVGPQHSKNEGALRVTNIEWTDKTWNPTRGCRRVSPGCVNCYAETQAIRFSGEGGAYEGLVRSTCGGPRWTGEGRFVPDKLEDPLHWRKPMRIFVDSMSDLFFEEFSNEQIAAVFGVMATAHWHTFQVLTKRPARALEWFKWVSEEAQRRHHLNPAYWLVKESVETIGNPARGSGIMAPRWPLSNVWIGASIEDQQRANERLPLLLQLPAALRFVSYEPALEAVDFCATEAGDALSECEECAGAEPDCELCQGLGRVDWLIVGGESGRNARPFDIAWARGAVAQCQDAGVPVFVKQLGAVPLPQHQAGAWDHDHPNRIRHVGSPGAQRAILDLRDKKGGDMSEWPADLRIREFPTVKK